MRLPETLNQLNDAVFLIDPRSDRLADANPRACAMLGYSRDELMSLSLAAVHPDEIQEFNTFARAVQAEGQGWTDELTCLTKSGDLLAAEISASMMVVEGISCLVAVVRPVSESRLYSRYVKAQTDLAVAEERSRLSREIHDTVTQSLSVMVLRLELAGDTVESDPVATRAELESLTMLAARCVDEVRRSIWDLQPLALESSSLVESVNTEMDKLRESGIKAEFRMSGRDETSMDRRHRSAALRIVQEALSNVIKHSGAMTASVNLEFGPESLLITVADDGTGFETRTARGITPAGGGFGITSMQDRANLTGGSLEVQSRPGQGTVVKVRIPYQPAVPDIAVLN